MTQTSVPQHSHYAAQQDMRQPNTLILQKTKGALHTSHNTPISDGAMCTNFMKVYQTGHCRHVLERRYELAQSNLMAWDDTAWYDVHI